MTDIGALFALASRAILPSAPDADRRVVTSFRGVYQASDNWCWAAVAASLQYCYASQLDPLAPLPRQCSIVAGQFGLATDACTRSAADLPCSRSFETNAVGCVHGDYDREWYLGETLSDLGLLERSVVLYSGKHHWVRIPSMPWMDVEVGDGLDFDEIKALINLDRPVCLRILRDGRRHFIVIYGYESYPDNDVLIWDPSEGPDVMDFNDLDSFYGPFTHKLITKPPSVAATPQEDAA